LPGASGQVASTRSKNRLAAALSRRFRARRFLGKLAG
jgi:hypothetical protein